MTRTLTASTPQGHTSVGVTEVTEAMALSVKVRTTFSDWQREMSSCEVILSTHIKVVFSPCCPYDMAMTSSSLIHSSSQTHFQYGCHFWQCSLMEF